MSPPDLTAHGLHARSHQPRVSTLSEIADIASGVTKGRRLLGETILVPYLRVANVQAGRLALDEVKEIAILLGELERFRLQAGDVLMTEGGDPDKLGRGAIWTGVVDPCVHQNHVFRVRLNRELSEPGYFVRYLASGPAVQYFLRAAKQTTGIATINKTQLGALPVPLPPLEEQRRIADILDKADAVRRKRKEAIALTEELLRSAFLEMFGDPVTNPKGWEVRRLGDVFAEPPRIGTLVPAQGAGNQLVVRVGELGSRDVALDKCRHVSLTEKDLERFLLTTGDVVLARAIGSEDHLGKASVLQATNKIVVFDSHVMRLRFDKKQLSPYVFIDWLRSEGGRHLFMQQAGRTAVQFNVNGQQIAKVVIPLPAFRIQQAYVDLVTHAQRTLCKDLESLRNADDLFSALVQRAFSGDPTKPDARGPAQRERFNRSVTP